MKFGYEEIGVSAAAEAEMDLVKVEAIEIEASASMIQDEPGEEALISLGAWEVI